MKYTRTALGLLTRQYRSVLKKCWLINVGLFALGAAGVMVPNEALAGALATITEGSSEDYSVRIVDNYYKVLLNTNAMTSDSNRITWAHGSGSDDYTISFRSYDGSTRSYNSDTYNYTLTGSADSRNTNVTASIMNGLYVGNSDNMVLRVKDGASVNIISGDFVSNQLESTNATGAVYVKNHSAVDTISGNFINNLGYKGAAVTNESSVINNIYGNFTGNKGRDGVIRNDKGGKVGNISGDFIGNKGTIVYNHDASVIENINGYFGYNEVYDGIIFNGADTSSTDASIINNIEADFVGNVSAGASFGDGLVYNSYYIGSIKGDFINNVSSNIIYNKRQISEVIGDFIGNIADKGGIITNLSSGSYGKITGNFINNKVSSNYGAITQMGYNAADITTSLVADDRDMVFYNNKTSNGEFVDIINQGGYSTSKWKDAIINLDASSGHSISFNGKIKGDDFNTNTTSVLNINQDDVNYGGEYNFNNEITYHNIYLGSGSNKDSAAYINLGKATQSDNSVTYGSISNSTLTNNAEGSTISMKNDYAGNVSTLKSMTLNNNLNFAPDVQLVGSSGTADKLNVAADQISGGGGIIINSINMTNTKYSDSGKVATVQIASANTGKY